MPKERIHRFEHGGKRYAIDPETCFCFECDAISWDVLEYYPDVSVNQIYHALADKHPRGELAEVVSELEWLRSTKSILTTPKREELGKRFEVERGLKRVVLRLPHINAQEAPRTESTDAPAAADQLGRRALELLLGRAREQKTLTLEFLEVGHVQNPQRVVQLCEDAARAARLAGKELTVAVWVTDVELAKTPKALEGHAVGAKLEIKDAQGVAAHLGGLARQGPATLARLAKTLQPEAPGVAGRIVVCPKHPEFGGVVPALDNAGFKIIELDLDGAYAADPRLEPQTMLAGLSQSAVYYAEKLRAHNYFRLDPIAPLFWRIYNGSPQPRSDPAGTNELAVDETGHVYPSWRLMGREEFRLGALQDGIIDEERLAEFENVGSVTTAACMRCWARNLCGGGTAAVHHALTGSFRTPCPDWCNAQREWMAAAVSAFNILSSAGVNFSRVYNTLASSAKPSLFALARAAFRMTVGMRPIEEADAAMLARWENWSDAAYFVYDESAVLMATRYDREMDALHPRGIDHELILLRKSGAPFGLLKIRPEQTPGTARAFVYLRNEADYAADSVRRGFRAILKEAGAQQSLRSFTVPAMKWEKKFAEFLLALGFSKAGTQREAVYLHGHYHDVDLYAGCTEKL